MARSRHRRALSAGACVLVAGSLALAQDRFSSLVEVNLVSVDAAVTDARGRPIDGLTRDDFELLVDGEPVEISEFSPARRGGGDVSDTVTPTYLAIYVDNASAEPQERNNLLAEISSTLLADCAAHCATMLISGDRTGLTIHRSFSTDSEAVRTGLVELQSGAGPDPSDSELEQIVADMEKIFSVPQGYAERGVAAQAQVMLARIRAYAEQARGDVVRTTAHLRQVVDSMSGLEGRRAIIYVGGGLSVVPGAVLVNALRDAIQRNPDVVGRTQVPLAIASMGGNEIEALSRYASARSVPLHSINASGRMASLSFGAATGSPEVAPGNAQSRDDAWSPGLGFRYRVDLEDSMRLMADETGGLAGRGNEYVDRALADTLGGLAGQYGLAFYAPESASAGEHRIEIRVRRKRTRVRHRQTYRLASRDQAAAERTLAALVLGGGENPLAARLQRSPTMAGGDEYLLALLLQVPLGRLAVRPQPSSHAGQLSIFYTSGKDGIAAEPMRKVVLPVTIANEELLAARGQNIEYRLEVPLRSGAGRVVVGVRDDLDPSLSVLAIDIEPPGAETGAAAEGSGG